MSSQANLNILVKLQDEASAGISKLGSSFGNFATMAAAGATVAAAAIVGFAASSIREYAAQEKANAQMAATLKSTHNAAGLFIEDLQDQATALQKLTTYTDDSIQSAQSLLLTFTNVKGAVFQEATSTILDMSTALGQDLKSSSIQVGKALNDPIHGITALSRVGVSFTEQQKAQVEQMVKVGDTMGAQRLILKELSTEFGGSAAAAANTFAGKLAQLGNAWGDFKETVGKALIEAITPAITKMVELAQAIDLSGVISTVSGFVGDLWKQFEKLWSTVYTLLKPSLTELWDTISTKLWPSLQQLFEALKPLAPVVELLLKAVGALLVAGLFLMIKALTQIVQYVSVAIQVFNFLVKHITEVLTPAFVSIGNVISGVVDWFKQLYDWVSKVVDKMKAFGSSGASLNPFSSSFKIPGLASGGIVTGPTLAMIGEGNGPEAVIPLDQLGKYGGGGGGIVVNITGNTISDQLDIDNLAQAVGESIMGKLQLQGRFSV